MIYVDCRLWNYDLRNTTIKALSLAEQSRTELQEQSLSITYERGTEREKERGGWWCYAIFFTKCLAQARLSDSELSGRDYNDNA